MSISIKFDTIKNARVTNNAQGLLIYRGVTVTGIPMDSGDSDPAILLKCIRQTGSPRFPQIDDEYPDPENADAKVIEQQLVSVDRNKNTIEATILYRKIPIILADPGGGAGGIFFTKTQQTQTSSVQTGITADGALPIKVWYKSGESGVQAAPAGIQGQYTATVQKIKCSEILRATGTATKAQWNAIKADIRAAAGKVNADNWGGYTEGRWLFLGPTTRTLDSLGNTLFIQLDFAGDPDTWYRFAVYRDHNGNIPDDIDNESILRANGEPGQGGMSQANGITWASVQLETPFAPLFGFTPD